MRFAAKHDALHPPGAGVYNEVSPFAISAIYEMNGHEGCRPVQNIRGKSRCGCFFALF